MPYRGKQNRSGMIVLIVVIILLAAAVATVLVMRGMKPAEPEASTPPPSESVTPTPVPTPTPTPSPEPTESEPDQEPYDFSRPVPQSDAAAEDYFSDAVFIGDSRTDGFLLYSGIEGASGIVHTGLTIFGVQDKKVIGSGNNKKTVLEALGEKQYGKVYLTLGVNELGYHNDTLFYNTYLEVIDAIRAVQPNAVIYIQNLIPVNESQVSKSYLENEHLRTYNDLMAKVAEEKQVAYLDLYSEFADENGQLPADASKDGVHMKKSYCQKWLAYLQCHVVARADMGLEE